MILIAFMLKYENSGKKSITLEDITEQALDNNIYIKLGCTIKQSGSREMICDVNDIIGKSELFNKKYVTPCGGSDTKFFMHTKCETKPPKFGRKYLRRRRTR